MHSKEGVHDGRKLLGEALSEPAFDVRRSWGCVKGPSSRASQVDRCFEEGGKGVEESPRTVQRR